MSNFQAVMKARARADPPKVHASGDSEMQEMLAQVDLLSVIQADAGESGHKSGGRIDFKSCPICHHRNCFSYYPSTNSWACFGDSNSSGYEGGTAFEYYKATRTDDNTEAVKWLRDKTGHPYKTESANDSTEAVQDEDSDGLLLPAWTAVKASEPPTRNPALIDGVLRRGHVMLLSGKGKIGKSFSAIELCVSVATGREEWFGLPLKSSGACLYIDPELDSRSLDNRFAAVCEAMQADKLKVDERISKWSLRGVAGANMNAIIHDLQRACAFDQFALVVVDSCSCFVEGDENSSVDIRAFSAKVLRIAEITGASVLLVHHTGKAKDGDREAADRARGSSVWLDFPDAILNITEVLPPSGEPSDYLESGVYACLLESGGIREFPRMEPIRLLFDYPIHRVDFEDLTDDWKPRSSSRDGANKTNEIKKAQKATNYANITAKLLAHFYANGIGEDGIIVKDAAAICDCDVRTLTAAVDKSDYLSVVQVTQRKRYIRPKNPPKPEPPELPLESN